MDPDIREKVLAHNREVAPLKKRLFRLGLILGPLLLMGGLRS
jgi:hypothetical protein